MSLAAVLRTLQEADRYDADRTLTATSSRHLASASKWSKKAEAALMRLQKSLGKTAKGSKLRRVQLDPASIAQELGISHRHG